MREGGFYLKVKQAYRKRRRKVSGNSHALFVEAGLLPEAMPDNFTFNKVREILDQLDNIDQESLREAIQIAKGLKIRSPLSAMIFVKHHLEGVHEVEVDRIDESEEGTHFAVLVYPEGEVTIQTEYLLEGVNVGSRLHYDPSKKKYC
jgi:hypothetical protein